VKKIESVSQAINAVAMAVLLAMVLLTVADVVGRYFFNQPVTGTTELTELMVVVVGFLGLAWCAVKGAHLTVDLVMSRLPSRLQAIVDSFNYFAGIVLCVIIAWRNFLEGIEVQELGTTTSLIDVPEFPFYWVIGFGFVMLCVVMVAHLIQHVTKAVKR
jgi:TRAP-type C4-dicarboxylate transport system permease small subunit